MEYQQKLFEYIRLSIYEPDKIKPELDDCPLELQKLTDAIKQFCEWSVETRRFAGKLAEGDLFAKPPGAENRLASELKALQSSLLHLNWLIEQVAKGDYNQTVNFMGRFSDVFNEMIRQLRERTESLGYVDTLTNCHNRRYCLEFLNKLYHGDKLFSIAFVDVDYLKYCNDSFGHKAGDRYLQHTVAALDGMPGHNIVCRMGGDEFVVIFMETEDAEAWSKLEAARNKIMERSIGDAGEKSESFSFGVMDFRKRGVLTINEFLDRADQKMYAYKMHSKKISRLNYKAKVADLERFYQHLPLGVLHAQLDIDKFGYNLSKGEIVNFNKQLAKMFGYTAEELMTLYQKDSLACVFADDREMYYKEIQTAIKNKTLHEFSYPGLRIQKKDGSIGVVQINIALANIGSMAEAYFIYTEIK